ncbi:D-glycero-alpha-D-manno-heptose-1,7-bisphosphate 7-phosphatase, partial [Streptomyces huiliensis]|uniref:D-glycero-alpha-D-manno-heptose-1,7-bisphosphate 7-phosphatase n=1 Tax=Streptomyces huiliensis TaxID=2876027 RepID=UPI00355884E5
MTARRLPAAVLFDRDGTLVRDVPYNGDPARVVPAPGARQAVAALRRLGVPLGVISNQSGVARGLLTPAQVDRVNARVERLLGRFDVWAVCPHGPHDGCPCRKPAPGLVLTAARALGVDPEDCVVIGDIGSDMEAAAAAGASGVLVPTRATRLEEVARAARWAPDLPTAVRGLLARGAGGGTTAAEAPTASPASSPATTGTSGPARTASGSGIPPGTGARAAGGGADGTGGSGSARVRAVRRALPATVGGTRPRTGSTGAPSGPPPRGPHPATPGASGVPATGTAGAAKPAPPAALRQGEEAGPGRGPGEYPGTTGRHGHPCAGPAAPRPEAEASSTAPAPAGGVTGGPDPLGHPYSRRAPQSSEARPGPATTPAPGGRRPAGNAAGAVA